MDVTSRLRAIVKSGPPRPVRDLTYEPDTGGYEASMDLSRVAAVLGGCVEDTPFGRCLVVDRRYEADRFHGRIKVGECDVDDPAALAILDPALFVTVSRADRAPQVSASEDGDVPWRSFQRTIFIDLETTGLSGGAGTMAFLVGCGFFDLGAFQVRQFLLTSHASERALLSAVAEFFDGADLIVTYNGKTFDLPVMETRWMFHRLEMPLTGVAHFDMLHPARRLWRSRGRATDDLEDAGCRLSTLERTLFDVTRVGDVGGFEIPGRFFQFLRTGDARPLEPVLEHNRLDLVSLAAVMARAVGLARDGSAACHDCAEALGLGRTYERAAADDRSDDGPALLARAEECYIRAAESRALDVKAEALYRLALRHRRARRFAAAAAVWRDVIALTDARGLRRIPGLGDLRQFAVEALAIHHEHRDRDLTSARELALFALEDADGRRADGIRHRIARLERKLSRKTDAQLFSS